MPIPPSGHLPGRLPRRRLPIRVAGYRSGRPPACSPPQGRPCQSARTGPTSAASGWRARSGTATWSPASAPPPPRSFPRSSGSTTWDNHFDAGLGLYWQVPVWDATEYTAASYESADPYHGGAGFRPTLNSYQYGDARAIAANPRHLPEGPTGFATYTFSRDDPQKIIDGSITYAEVPQTTRWTSYGSPNASDSAGVDFHRPVLVDDVRLFFYDDDGGVRTPAGYGLQFWDGGGWAAVQGQVRSPATPAGNTLNRITFPAVRTSRLRVAADNPGPGTGWRLSGFQVWSAPAFHIVNAHSGKLLAIDRMSAADGAHFVQYTDNGTADHRWMLLPAS